MSSHIPPPPHVNSFVLGPAVINTHTSAELGLGLGLGLGITLTLLLARAPLLLATLLSHTIPFPCVH
jgi:hypothetical protein